MFDLESGLHSKVHDESPAKTASLFVDMKICMNPDSENKDNGIIICLLYLSTLNNSIYHI